MSLSVPVKMMDFARSGNTRLAATTTMKGSDRQYDKSNPFGRMGKQSTSTLVLPTSEMEKEVSRTRNA
jgi:hypothetical protein